MVKNLPALQETWVWILQGPNCYPSNIKSTYKTESLSCLVERGQALGQFTRENAAWLSFLRPWTSQEGGSTLRQGERWRSHSGADVKKWVRHESSEVPNMSCSIITFRDLKKNDSYENSISEAGGDDANLLLFFPHLTLITIKLKGKNLTLHLSSSFRSISILNHSSFEAENFHRHVNA